jgi:hypothetical protein
VNHAFMVMIRRPRQNADKYFLCIKKRMYKINIIRESEIDSKTKNAAGVIVA